MSLRISKYSLAIVLLVSLFMLVNSGIADASTCYVRPTACGPSPACTSSETNSNTCKLYDIPTSQVCASVTGGADVCQRGCCCDIIPGNAKITVSGLCNLDLTDKNFIQGVNVYSDCLAICSNTQNVKWNITGTIRGSDGNPIVGANVSINSIKLTTDINGAYKFADFSPGTYTVLAAWSGCSNSGSVVLSQNKVVDIVVNCNYYSVTGYVKNAAGVVSGADVKATINGIPYHSITDAGKYILAGILQGNTFSISANKSTCQGFIDISNPLLKNIDDADALNPTNITLSCNKWNVAGTIYDGTNTVSDAIVTTNRGGTSSTDIHGSYNIIGVPEGAVTVTATTPPIVINGKTHTCQNSVAVNLLSNIVQDIYLNCCDMQCFDSTCINGVITTTCVRSGTCTGPEPVPTTKSCNALPACQWNCTAWTTCNAGDVQQTRTCDNKFTNNCDATILVNKPSLIQSCPTQCGDGYVNATIGEDCDYNQHTGVFNSSASCVATYAAAYKSLTGDSNWGIKNMTTSTCNVATCTCKQPPTSVVVPSCIEEPGNISTLNISQVARQHAFNLTWNLTNYTCASYVQNFKLRLCTNSTGQNAGQCFDVNNSISGTSREYFHVSNISNPIQIKANQRYCYTLTVVFNKSVQMPLTLPTQNRMYNITTCIIAGDEQCMDNHLDSWCIGNNNVSCFSNNTLRSQTCGSTTILGHSCNNYCTVADGNAQCDAQCDSQFGNQCDMCNSMFGLFSYQGFSPLMYGMKIVCPSLSYPAPTPDNTGLGVGNHLFGCYADYSMTSIDKAYSCSDVSSCYDYSSESSCEQDYCGKFTTDDKGNGCEWVNDNYNNSVKNIFGKGVCRPKDVAEQNCNLCNDLSAGNIQGHNRLYSECTQNICGLYGYCFFNKNDKTCMNGTGITCTSYDNSGDCIGQGTSASNVNVDVQWSSSLQSYSLQTKISGKNTVLARSNDYLRMGVCKWTGTECIRDTDNNNLEDCGKFTGDEYLACGKDFIPPNTIINSRTYYGLVMDMRGEVTVSDNNPWPLGDNVKDQDTKLLMYYCIAPAYHRPCYPNATMILTNPLSSYIVNVSKFSDALGNPISAADNGNQFTMYYFSEDPAKNLEAVKSFTFTLDAKAPVPNVNILMKTFNVTSKDWLTNLTVTFNIISDEKSWPVDCTFALHPPATGTGVLLFSGKEIYNIPSTLPPYNTEISGSSNSLTTMYPELSDGVYTYDLHCIDSAKNQYDATNVPIRIDDDLTINDHSPPIGPVMTFTSKEFEKNLDGNVSINTTQPGLCRYSSDTYDYSLMKNNFTNRNFTDKIVNDISGSIIYFHNSTVTLPSTDASGIYWYYVACNLTINGEQKIVRGDDADNINFAIDDIGPKTTLMYESDITTPSSILPYDPSGSTAKELDLHLACDDFNARLNASNGVSLAFGCDDTGTGHRYYCIQRVDGLNNCSKNINTDYSEVKFSDRISLDYTTHDSADKLLYGNYPAIYYYSLDNGGNIGAFGFTRLNIKNTDLKDPDVIFTTYTGKISYIPGITLTTPTLTDAYAVISVNYSEESNVMLTASLTRMVGSNGAVQNVPFNIVNAVASTATSAKFYISRQYFDNGEYTLTLNATDDDGNARNTVVPFSVNHQSNTVHLISPSLGIGQSKSYDISVGTDYNSTCKYSLSRLDSCPNTLCRYSDSSYKTFDTIDASGSIHGITGYDGSNSGTLYVICKTLGSLDDSDASFALTSFPVGYNMTAPNIAVTFIGNPYTNSTDNRIVNSSYNTTIMQVSTDQLSVCSITNDDDNSARPALYEDSMFNSNGVTENQGDYSTYSNMHNITLDYRGKLYAGVTSESFRYNITCVGAAQFNSTKGTTVLFAVDTQNPVVSYAVDNKYITLKKITVSCTDDSGCSNGYYYQILPQSADCNSLPSLASYAGPVNYAIPIQLNSSSKVCLAGLDIMGNMGTNELNVNVVQFDNGNLTIKSPYYYSDNKVYSNSRIFTLNAQTDVNASCRYIASSNSISTSSANYASIIYSAAIPFDVTGNTSHNVGFVINAMPNVEEGWIIICNASNADSVVDPYIRRELFFYWDNSTPVDSVAVSPSPVYDWNNNKLLHFVVDTDDDTYCMINGTLSDNLKTADLSAFDSYTTHHEYNYSIINSIGSSSINNIGAITDIPLNVTCVNRAVLSSEDLLSVHYEINKTLFIIRNSGSEFSGAASPVIIPVNVTTNIMARCELFVDDKDSGKLSTTDRLTHFTTVNVNKGVHNFRIDCNVPESADIISASTGNYTVYADVDLPTITLAGPYNGYTCSLNGFSVNVNTADDTGIAGYYYSISGPDGMIVPLNYSAVSGLDTISSPAALTLMDGASYTVSAQAVDIAGKVSAPASVTVIAHSQYSSITCDITPPVITIAVSKYGTGNNAVAVANVTCSDSSNPSLNQSASGCTGTFIYSMMPNQKNCIGASYNLVGDYNKELIFYSDGTLCVKGSDAAGHITDKNFPLDITPISCGNGVIDSKPSLAQIAPYGSADTFNNWDQATYDNLIYGGALSEQCDGAALGGDTCLSQGFVSGTLGCTNTCNYDLSGCQSGMNVSIISPQPLGIGATPIYTLTVASEYNATCRYGFMIDDSNITRSFNGMTVVMTPNQNSGNKIHSTSIDASSESAAAAYSVRDVICQMNNLTGYTGNLDKTYGITQVYEGYDSSAPTIIVATNRENDVVDDWNDRTISLIMSTSEPAVCTIDDGLTGMYHHVALEDASDYDSYTTSHQVNVNYSSFDSSNHDVTYVISCANRAGISSSVSKIVHYNIVRQLTIQKIAPTSDYDIDNTAYYHIQTNVLSSCTINNNTQVAVQVGAAIPMSDNNPMHIDHYATIGIADGNNNIKVACTSTGPGNDYAEATYNIYGHAIGPQDMTISVNDNSCGLNNVSLGFNAQFTTANFAQYSYKIVDAAAGVTMIDWTNTTSGSVSPSINLVADRQYTVFAEAFDTAGYGSSQAISSFTARSSTSRYCDNTVPVIAINILSNSIFHADVKVSCSGSNYCNDTFNYRLINQSQSCNDTIDATYSTYDNTAYYTDTLTFDNTPLKLCVKGYTWNGVNGYAEKNITLVNLDSGTMGVAPSPSYTFLEDRYIVATNNIFDLSVTTGATADCRYVFADNTLSGKSLGVIYSGAKPFSITGGATHTINGFDIASSENAPEDWLFICVRNDISNSNIPDSEKYISRVYRILYDNSTPMITSISATAVTDRWNKQSTLTITSDDPTTCYIDNAQLDATDDTTQYSAYTKLHEKSLDYASYDDTPRNITYNVYCKNLAQQSTVTVPVKVIYDLNDTLTLTKVDPYGNNPVIYLAANSTLLTFSTSLEATCSGSINNNAFSMTALGLNNNEYYYDIQLNNLNDTNTLAITCTRGGSSPVTQLYTIYANTVSPVNMQISSDSLTCSLSTITAQFSAASTVLPIRGYYYNITDVNTGMILVANAFISAGANQATGTQMIGANSVTNSVMQYAPSGGLTDGHDYRIDAYAVDTAGYASDIEMAVLPVSSGSNSLCDHNAPTLTITDMPASYLDVASFNIACTDLTGSGSSISGCTNTYKYKLINAGGNCDNTTAYDSLESSSGYSVRSYGDTLTLMSGGILCVAGADKNNNVAHAQTDVSVLDNNTINITPVNVNPDNNNGTGNNNNNDGTGNNSNNGNSTNGNNGNGASGNNVLVLSPSTIVTTSPMLNITVSTSLNATCRYGLTASSSTDLSQLFSNYIPFDITGHTIHTILNFDTKSNYEQYVDVICSSNLASKPYSEKTLQIIYIAANDTPVISASVYPSTVFDWNYRTSELSIVTDTDTVCAINSNDGQNTPYTDGDLTNALTYAKNHHLTLNYATTTASPSIFTYAITCTNFANLSSSTSTNLTYNMSTTLSAVLLSPTFYRNSSIDLTLQTSLVSSCVFTWNNFNMGILPRDNSNTYHVAKLQNLADGQYAASYLCTTPILNLHASANYTITINTTSPTTYCGDNIVEIPNNNNQYEQCDGIDIAGRTCSQFIGYSGGILGCKSDCTYDISKCDTGLGYCGDNVIEGPNSAGLHEQCDGSVPSDINCQNFGFDTGSLSCINCQINTSGCRYNGVSVASQTLINCGDNLLESGEQCEQGMSYNITCSFFNYDYGTVNCNSCAYDISGCYMNATINNTLPASSNFGCNNNGIKEYGEECDGTGVYSGLSTVSCQSFNFSGGTVGCTGSCRYDTSKCYTNDTFYRCSNGVKDITEADVDCGGDCKPCALNKTCFGNSDCTSNSCVMGKCVVNPCTNNVFDNGTETDVDCGGTCGSCSNGKNCVANTDCTSGFCISGTCSVNPCTNGIKDNGELDVDCGGTCSSCNVGQKCNVNSDCSSDNCVNNACAEAVQAATGTNLQNIKTVLLILGILLTLGAGGYITYNAFSKSGSGKKSRGGGGMSGTSSGVSSPSVSQSAASILGRKNEKNAAQKSYFWQTGQQQKLTEKQKELLMKKHEEREEQRQSLLKGLDVEPEIKGHDKNAAAKNSNAELNKSLGRSITSASSTSASLAKKESAKKDDEYVDITSIKGKKMPESGNNTAGNNAESMSGSADDRRDVFDRLKSIGKSEDVIQKIAQISGASKESIKPALLDTKLSDKDAIKLFGNLDRSRIMSDVFKDILSHLLKSGTITKENVSNVLFEYMDRGLLSKADVAKISSELKLI